VGRHTRLAVTDTRGLLKGRAAIGKARPSAGLGRCGGQGPY
jgi:hypothetical protein